MENKTKKEIKIWGPLKIDIDEKTQEVWGSLSKEAIEKMGKKLEQSNTDDFSKEDFYRVLEITSHSNKP